MNGKNDGTSSNKQENIVQTENKIGIDTLPKTGEETKGVLSVLYIIVGACSLSLAILILIKRKRN